ncbi:hypothetical protein [Aquimarina algicola]|uniref:Uncharacterized protein n=1 Tax=Aquimarina algicola TaxID=2589995 RepID=A0A504JAZ6_9FLAO|nr:hypothetical protein [Aquimarina algicola]TPN84703.1 hypothetical protein FHK87_17400 [Aquimarina algicola]
MEEQYKNIKRLIRETGLETPSYNFTNKVMNKIAVLETHKQSKPTALISRQKWVVIILIFIALFFGALLVPNTSNKIFSMIDFSFFNIIRIKNVFPKLIFSHTTIYGISFLCILFFVQLIMLKRRIDKRFSV